MRHAKHTALNASSYATLCFTPCCAWQGLLLLRNGSRQVEFVASRTSHSSPLEPDSPIIYANDLDIASDGMVYFTSSVDIMLHRCGFIRECWGLKV